MSDIVSIRYPGRSAANAVDARGMRAMQRKAFDARGAQYLLIKSPPASGKSRALMYIALDKLREQGIRKVIVAVPEKTIGASFAPVALTETGFDHDWTVEPRNDLCGFGGSEKGTTAAFQRFMASDDEVLVCTHSTLRFAFDAMGDDPKARAAAFADCLVAVDEFHHGSADEENRLGNIVRALIADGRPHIVAMTGSYFRGDRVPVMDLEDEAKFSTVVFTYYDQLAGYEYLKTLTLGYAFYDSQRDDGVYSAVDEALDLSGRTIIHLPYVNAASADPEGKIAAMNRILDGIGEWQETDPVTGFLKIKSKADGRIVKVADLVTPDTQGKVQTALRDANRERDHVHVVIAQNMGKEGFDWIWCDHAITLGTKYSMTEVVQIIGRTTRDAPGKSTARFTNLIAEPNDSDETVREAVNGFLKAIAISLLMEQITMPNFQFKAKPADAAPEWTHPGIDITTVEPATVHVKGLVEPASDRGRKVLEDLPEIMAAVAADERVAAVSLAPSAYPPDYVAKVLIPDIVEKRTGLTDEDDIEAARQRVVLMQHMAAQLRHARTAVQPELVLDGMGGVSPPETAERERTTAASATSAFLDLSKRVLMVGEFDIDLIDRVNPFQQSYEIVSKRLDEQLLRTIHGVVLSKSIEVTEEEAKQGITKIRDFKTTRGHEPRITASDPIEKRLAEILAWVRKDIARRKQGTA